MILNSLSILNFKNYEQAELSFSPGVNCFVGNNGEGKTNLLDAIHYLSVCKSGFNPVDRQNIRLGEGFFILQGVFEKNGRSDTIGCSFKRGQRKQVRKNKKEYERLADHIGLYPVVMITPYDVELIYEGSEVRRKFMDSIISQYKRPYLESLMAYNKILQQRNAQLKQFGETRQFREDLLQVWDHQLIPHGRCVFEERKAFIDIFLPQFQHIFEIISGGKDRIDLDYKSDLYHASFEDVLRMARENDRFRQYSTAGIHKDNLIFQIMEQPLKKFGSQGQQKSYLIALKLAQFELIRQQTGITPILLLDDIFDKLDMDRVRQLMELVQTEKFGQIFITDAHAGRMPEVLHKMGMDFQLFHVKENRVEV